jgi:hypothetical protein
VAKCASALGAATLFSALNGFGVDQPLGGAAAARIFLLGSREATNTEKTAYFGAGSVQVDGGFLSGEPATGRYAHFEKSSSATGALRVIHSNGIVSFLATTSAMEGLLDERKAEKRAVLTFSSQRLIQPTEKEWVQPEACRRWNPVGDNVGEAAREL